MGGIIVLSNEADRTCAIWLSPYSRLLGNSTVRVADFSPAKCRFDEARIAKVRSFWCLELKMKIEKINISEITEYENNAKLHPREQIEQIKKSIQEFGNNDPIAIDENNVIIEGHGRYKALKELGFDEVEVIRLSHMDDEQKRAYILAHNKLTMNSGFDIELLNSEHVRFRV